MNATVVKIAIDLDRFCDKSGLSHEKNQMEKPFSLDEYTYATNGHILVRVPRQEDIPPVEHAPNPTKLFSKWADDQKWIQVPDFSLNMLWSYHDRAWQIKTEAIKVGGKVASSIYLYWISKLPSALIAPEATEHQDPIPFKFDGGQGLLMPLRD